MKYATLGLLALAALSPLAIGCAADTEDAAVGVGEDEVKQSSLLGPVGAIGEHGGDAVAAPAKVKRILTNLGLLTTKAPKEGAVRCLPMLSLEIFAPDGALAGSVAMCGGASLEGTLTAKGKSYLIKAKDLGAVTGTFEAPKAVADYLWGADAVEIGDPMDAASNVSVTDPAMIARAVASMKGDDVPDADGAFSRCIPKTAVSFKKGEKELASVNLDCSGASGIVPGKFYAEDPKILGIVKVDSDVLATVRTAAAR